MSSGLKLVVAHDINLGIGYNNELPWYIPDDLQHFRKLTLGQEVVQGRKTYESIIKRLGQPLPDRDNIVLSRQSLESYHDNVSFYNSSDKVLLYHPGAFIIGGAEIYKKFLPFVKTIYSTLVLGDYDCDTFLEKDFYKDFIITAEKSCGTHIYYKRERVNEHEFTKK